MGQDEVQKGTGQISIWDTLNLIRGRSQTEVYYVPEDKKRVAFLHLSEVIAYIRYGSEIEKWSKRDTVKLKKGHSKLQSGT